MSYKTVLTNLYYLLIHSDGDVSEKEASVGLFMCQHEGISQSEFDQELQSLASAKRDLVFSNTVKGLKMLRRSQQVKSIAWLCLVANSDGFMDKEEWKFIYKLYCSELKLPLDEVLAAQKELSRSRPHFSTMVAPLHVRTVL